MRELENSAISTRMIDDHSVIQSNRIPQAACVDTISNDSFSAVGFWVQPQVTILNNQFDSDTCVYYDPSTTGCQHYVSPRTAIAPRKATLRRTGKYLTLYWDIYKTLLRDRDEASLEGENHAEPDAVDACTLIAHYMRDLLTTPLHDFKWAVFGDDNGCSLLIMRHLATQRRVEFRIPSDGRNITVITIDNNLKLSSQTINTDDVDIIQESAKWVVGQV